MGERQILYTGSMVRSILEDRKTMTRRVVKPQPAFLYGITADRITSVFRSEIAANGLDKAFKRCDAAIDSGLSERLR